MRLHEGSIKVNAAQNMGTVFTLEFLGWGFGLFKMPRSGKRFIYFVLVFQTPPGYPEEGFTLVSTGEMSNQNFEDLIEIYEVAKKLNL